VFAVFSAVHWLEIKSARLGRWNFLAIIGARFSHGFQRGVFTSFLEAA